ncbi:MAG: nuclear transport factor 2 family protein [Acidimicrobiales bacterium]
MTAPLDDQVRHDVADVLVRYATGIDRRDWALFRSCFTDDCEADYGEIGVWHGAEEITTWMRETHEPCGHTMHRITNQVVTPRDGGVAARSYVDAIVMFGDKGAGTRGTGYYDDELVRTDEGWKISRRRFTLVLLQLLPEGSRLELGT